MTRQPYSKKEGAIYVMKIKGHKDLRVGIHSTSDGAREGQVKRGLGVEVKIKWSQPMKSKAHALAAEALAHLYLSRFERWKSIGGRENVQVFVCSQEVAIAACKRVVSVVDNSHFV